MQEFMKVIVLIFFISTFYLLIPGRRASQITIQDAPIQEELITDDIKSNSFDATTNSEHYILSNEGGQSPSGNSPICRNLEVIITHYPNNALRVKILDKDNEKRWQIPEIEPFPYFRTQPTLRESGCCTVDVTPDPFSIKITRKDNQEVIFDTSGSPFVYSDLYLELTGKVPSGNIYGYGERFYKFKLESGIYTIWGRDEPTVKESTRGGGNIYGHHPVGLVRDNKGKFFVVLMKNSNAMDVIIGNPPSIGYKIVGGVIDLVFFIGDEKPDTALKNYHEYIGKFVMMPFWSLGNHQCRWGYKNVERLEEIVNKFREYDIPLDTIWSDIDYMVEKEDFNIDTRSFNPTKMKRLFETQKVHWVPIIDAGIKQNGYGAKEGKSRNIFVKNVNGEDFNGRVWPGAVHFVDFFNPDAEQYWIDMLEFTIKQIPFSGIWLDMNEIANFDHGEQGKPSKYDVLPYTPGNRQLKTKTLSCESVHYGNIEELNVHELHSILQNKATYRFLLRKTKLPFILTRSSSFGTGQYSAHWTGDNGADWDYLRYSISGNFNFQIFGQPFVGADICGFMGNTNAELCARWIQLGAYSPFTRNHNQDMSRDQEPWVFEHEGGLGPKVLPTYRAAIKFKYAILKWFYSLFLSVQGVGSVWKPLIFEFSNEEILYKDANYNERQIMLGSGVMVVPCVEQYQTTVSAYFPKAKWFEIGTGKQIISEKETNRVITIDVPFETHAPAFIRDGYIMHLQDIEGVKTTLDLTNEYTFAIAFRQDSPSKWESEGKIMGITNFDDETIYSKCILSDCFYTVRAQINTVDFGQTTFHVTFLKSLQFSNVEPISVKGLDFYGVPLLFSSEDDSKEGYAMVELFDQTSTSLLTPKVFKPDCKTNGAYLIDFDIPISIKPGDFFKVQIVA